MKLLSVLKFFILITFFTQAYAQAENADLSNMLNAMQSMRASFTQTIYDNRGKAISRSYGQMAMQRPGKFRWEVTKPVPQLIIANATRLWIYDRDLEQVTIRSLSLTAGEIPALLLSHVNSALDKAYIVKSMPNMGNERWFNLVPRNADNMFASIQMGFINNQIHEMKLQDHLGHTTKIQFNNLKLNPPIAANTFVFKAPAKVDVIDETRKR